MGQDLVRVSFKDYLGTPITDVVSVTIENVSAEETYDAVALEDDPSTSVHPFFKYEGIEWLPNTNQFIENDKFIARRISEISNHSVTDVAKLRITKVVTTNKTWEDIVVQ